MFINKHFTVKEVMQFSGRHLIWLTTWAVFITALFEFTHWEWMSIPWLPLAAIGTAVAFYLGFKNNSAYDRLWEARKIWGAIVNSSRMWGATTRSFVSNQFTDKTHSEAELQEIHRKLLYRHIGWLYALRGQLLVPTPWEHISQSKHYRKVAEQYKEMWGVGMNDEDVTKEQIALHLPADELERLKSYKNTATQIIDQQSQDLKELRSQNLIDDFRHMELQKILNDFYIHQGKAERIKKFPLPRQYGSASFIFVSLFIFLLPFGIVSEFHKLGEFAVWLSVPFIVIVGWVFVMMELIGDYSENPFEGLGNDIPMLSLCRTIEIDLKEMLGEDNIPPAIESRGSVLI
ncbi:MAG: bestrophin family ion channel [Flavipsychrobacter sp.]